MEYTPKELFEDFIYFLESDDIGIAINGTAIMTYCGCGWCAGTDNSMQALWDFTVPGVRVY